MASSAQRVGRYELLGELGHGGMATVHLARQLDLDRLIALKQLDALARRGDVRITRFVREARLAASLSHPNIVTVHDAFEVGDVPYIAMELVPGGTLREVRRTLSLEQVAGVLDGVLDGLAHAERRRIVHRDLKPDNLMVTAEGSIKITDFGIAKATSAAQGEDGALTTAGVAIGTPAYMAPEQAMGEEVGPWTDLYALGVIAFELLAGELPFRRGTSSLGVLLQQVDEAPPAIRDLRPGVDAELADWVARLLAKSPPDRPAGAAVAREELEDTILRLRGPRWRRDSALPVADALPAVMARATASHGRPRVRREPLREAPAAAPVARVAPAPRLPRGLAPLVIAALALVAIVVGARSVGSLSPAVPASAPVSERAVTPAAPAAATPTVAATATATATAAADAMRAPPVDRIGLDDAERESRRFAEEAQDTEGDGDERLTQELRDTAAAYREAVTAGTAGDASAFSAALARADELARQSSARLDGD